MVCGNAEVLVSAEVADRKKQEELKAARELLFTIVKHAVRQAAMKVLLDAQNLKPARVSIVCGHRRYRGNISVSIARKIERCMWRNEYHDDDAKVFRIIEALIARGFNILEVEQFKISVSGGSAEWPSTL